MDIITAIRFVPEDLAVHAIATAVTSDLDTAERGAGIWWAPHSFNGSMAVGCVMLPEQRLEIVNGRAILTTTETVIGESRETWERRVHAIWAE